jgi:hypothetical protein
MLRWRAWHHSVKPQDDRAHEQAKEVYGLHFLAAGKIVFQSPAMLTTGH